MIQASSFFSGVFHAYDIHEVLGMPDLADYCAFLLCTRGHLSIYLNGRLQEMYAHDLLHWQFDDVVVPEVMSEDFACGITLVHRTGLLDVLDMALRVEKDVQAKFLYAKQYPLQHLTPAMEQLLRYYGRLMQSLTRMPDSRYRRLIANTACLMLYQSLNWWTEQRIELLKTCSAEGQTQNIAVSQSADLMYRFYRLLGSYGGRERTVGWYASQLHITPKYLNNLCMQVEKQSPLTIINDFAVLEIKKMLADCSLCLQDIAARLQFTSTNNLCKYFRCHAGMSPMEYRKMLYKKE